MPTIPRLAIVLLPLLISGCAWLPQRDRGPVPPPNPPVFCYDTLGRAACYDQPQMGLGELINAQLPPVVVVAPAPVIVVPATAPMATVLTPAQVEAIPDTAPAIVTTTTDDPASLEPIVIRNPDPYPAPEYKPRH